jgi:hypothetical protein
MKLVRFVALGAALTYFFDPTSGRRRRTMARDRVGGFFRRAGRRTGRAARHAASDAHGMKQKITHRREAPKPTPDDITLARKVETEIFREPGMPKGQVNINVEDGVVFLRGEVESTELIEDLADKARDVEGVRDVQNLLHTPGTPAPTSGER